MPIDFSTALGRLLTNVQLRQEFVNDPKRAAARLGVRDEDHVAFTSLSPNALVAQAEGLRRKRMCEVAKLLPRTRRSIGDRFAELFRIHAERFWPAGHRRHVIDAHTFCELLASMNDPGLCRAEWVDLRLRLSPRGITICYVPDLIVGGFTRKAIVIHVGLGRFFTKRITLYLGIGDGKGMRPCREAM